MWARKGRRVQEDRVTQSRGDRPCFTETGSQWSSRHVNHFLSLPGGGALLNFKSGWGYTWVLPTVTHNFKTKLASRVKVEYIFNQCPEKNVHVQLTRDKRMNDHSYKINNLTRCFPSNTTWKLVVSSKILNAKLWPSKSPYTSQWLYPIVLE